MATAPRSASASALPNGNSGHAYDAGTIPIDHVAHQSHDTRPAPAPPAAAPSKKSKSKKSSGPADASKLISQRISQLELDVSGERDQEAEIEREVKKASRELNSQTAKMNEMQKIEHLTKRSSELLREMKKHERENIKNKKRADQLQKEKDHSRSELSKNIGLRDKLEKLCRELQRDNNKYKAEIKGLKDNQVRSQNSWDEKYATLLQKLDDCQDDKDNPCKQVIDLEMEEVFRTRFKSILDQYEIRDLHFHSLMRTKELEVQAQLARAEHERKKADVETGRAQQLNEQVQTFSKTETELRHQLSVYVDKFKQVEDTLNNSNDLFLTFRKEMEDMSKKTKRLERENERLKTKHEAMNQNIFKMAEERSKNLRDLSDGKRREDKMKNIISYMQKQGRPAPPILDQAMEYAPEEEEERVTEGENEVEDENEDEGEDSEYDYDDEISDTNAEYGDDDDLDEEEHPPRSPMTFGPERPPPALIPNGTKH